MKRELEELYRIMAQNGIDAYLIPTTDYHGSEYVNQHFWAREFLSGFTGSNGDMVLTPKGAALWTDGRYFIQAKQQLKDTGISLMKMGVEGTPTIIQYLLENLNENDCLGFYGPLVSAEEGRRLEDELAAKGIRIKCHEDLVGKVWHNRPAITPSQIWALPMKTVGKSSQEKLAWVRTKMQESGATQFLITNLEEIAWLLNLRGNDIECTPVFFAYMLVDLHGGRLYVYPKEENIEFLGKMLPEEITIGDYFQVSGDIAKLQKGEKLSIDVKQSNYDLYRHIPKDVEIIQETSPIQFMKAVKNGKEIESTIKAHIKDGVAMVRFIYWIKQNIGHLAMTEISAADYLEKCRRQEEGCFDLSFDTIAGYGQNGAIIHYSATKETNAVLQPKGLLLVDSGGQFNQGTTDITRTIALGELTTKMKECYTAVLKGNLHLAGAVIDRETTGAELDKLAREPINAIGYDYKHGTGHGVGHILSVHEGPNTISTRGKDCRFLPGMITSNEPGIYLEGEFGIRLENELLCVNRGNGKLGFQTLTLCPWEREAILVQELTQEEKDMLNGYHREVYEKLSPYLNENERSWLEEVTSPLEK